MQRKPGFPVANCIIKMPDSIPISEAAPCDNEGDQHQRRLQLINFGHSQWGFNNWSWSITKQDLDFVDFANGKYCAGVAAFVAIHVKSLDIRREDVGYATCVASTKGAAIYQARKCATTNGLRESLLAFGGSVASELLEILEAQRVAAPPEPLAEINHNILNNKLTEPKNSPLKIIRKDSVDSISIPVNIRPTAAVKNAGPNPSVVAKAMPIAGNLPPAANRAPLAPNPPRPPPSAPHIRPNANVSFVLQPVMGGMTPIYAAQHRMPPMPTQLYPNFFDCAPAPWHFTYETYDRHHGNVNLNFNIPPKNLVVTNRSGSVECRSACMRPGVEGEPIHYAHPPQNQGCWIKPTIFYDGFWTEQKVKKWVAEQVEKQFPEELAHKSSSPSNSGAEAPKS